MTHSERFDIQFINGSYCAPYTWGCPKMRFDIDYAVFKKTQKERDLIYTFKKKMGKTKHHKFVSYSHVSV